MARCAAEGRIRCLKTRHDGPSPCCDGQWGAHGLRITGLGIAGGLLLSVAAVKLLRGFLCPFDPVAFAFASTAWLIVAMLASWYPARRATRVDPLTALKYE